MNILCVDTSGPLCGVAILAENTLRYEATLDARMTHSQTLMPLVEQGFALTGLQPADVNLYAVIAGPGSFTGVRIGVATIKGLAAARQTPCVAANALEILALNGRYWPGVVCPLLDARAGQVYGAAFDVSKGTPERMLPDKAVPLTEYLQAVAALDKPPLFVGDGLSVHQEALAQQCPSGQIAPWANAGLRAGLGAQWAMENAHRAVPPSQLLPIYLRAPQAVREKLKREATAHE